MRAETSTFGDARVDEERDAWLAGHRLMVTRVRNNEAMGNLDGVLAQIAAAAERTT